MGVPGFFAWLLRKYKHNKNIILNTIKCEKVDFLYLDSNCLFHPQCFTVLEKAKKLGITDIDKIEDMMMKRIIKYIDYLVNIVDPTTTYISVDGVAPMAKINQQRGRRFRSPLETEQRDKIKSKFKLKIDNIWTNAVITPGTDFMERLHNVIIDYINKSDRKFLYSSYHMPGEGEHKILQHIKNNYIDNQVSVIYGLDADLIFLSLSINKDNVYLLRENYHFNKNNNKSIPKELNEDDIINNVEEDLNYVSIDETKDCLNRTVIDEIEDKMGCIYDSEKDFSVDLIFLCYLLGNDFLPHLPSIDIKIGGLGKLINVYVDLFCENGGFDLVYDKTMINQKILLAIFERLSGSETYYFSKRLKKHIQDHKERKPKREKSYDAAISNLENLKNIKIHDPIKLGEGTPKIWKYKYYEHYFSATNNQDKLIEDMCKEYIKGIKWVTEYYFNECPCWRWFYPYSHTPFVSDIFYFLQNTELDINKFEYEGIDSLPPLTQLLSVLPSNYNNILPKSYQYLTVSDDSPIIDMYPSKIKIDMINQIVLYKCIPILPILDINRIENAICGLELTDEEKERNISTNELITN